MTLEELGYTEDLTHEFCPSIEYSEYTNGKNRIIFWKRGTMQFFTDDGEDFADLPFDEMRACVEMIERMGW